MSKKRQKSRIARINARPFLVTYPDGRQVLTIPPGATLKQARKLLKAHEMTA